MRYIFIPLIGAGKNQAIFRNLFTSMFVFGFVYMWHGLRNDHLVWASLNWFGVLIEKIADDIYRKKAVQEFEVSVNCLQLISFQLRKMLPKNVTYCGKHQLKNSCVSSVFKIVVAGSDSGGTGVIFLA